MHRTAFVVSPASSSARRSFPRAILRLPDRQRPHLKRGWQLHANAMCRMYATVATICMTVVLSHVLPLGCLRLLHLHDHAPHVLASLAFRSPLPRPRLLPRCTWGCARQRQENVGPDLPRSQAAPPQAQGLRRRGGPQRGPVLSAPLPPGEQGRGQGHSVSRRAVLAALTPVALTELLPPVATAQGRPLIAGAILPEKSRFLVQVRQLQGGTPKKLASLEAGFVVYLTGFLVNFDAEFQYLWSRQCQIIRHRWPPEQRGLFVQRQFRLVAQALQAEVRAVACARACVGWPAFVTTVVCVHVSVRVFTPYGLSLQVCDLRLLSQKARPESVSVLEYPPSLRMDE